MTGEKQTIIKNREIHDSSSKLIFGDKILSSQFFRDYADMDILRNIKPEDIEDVSERYVPLYSTERESDTVKKVNISRYLHIQNSEEVFNLPLYIISLIEHKTKVEYNVIMQVLRYVIYIWEDYEKEMNEKFPGISKRKDFKYPPILPIVYYEGKQRWTASLDIADKILCKELLGEYLPHFRYQLVRLHDYSNEELLEKEDEISLAMLINKIQEPGDISVLSDLPKGQVDRILKDTPEYLLEIMAKLYRALLYNIGASEAETEKAVATIKERKMARLFENVPRNFKAAEKRTEKKINMMQQKLDAMQKELVMYKHIIRQQKGGRNEQDIIHSLMQEFSLTKEQAEEALSNITEELD
ncbi:MAG: Rpn family recombination-promoting nuclease/putative transposase [Lachnospiraceae bacterium]|nr:Rpn family recombination-promoting nuclease/putative transposase [Lachnospiraceae bacterium]